MDKSKFMTPIRYKIEKILPKLVRKYSPKEPVVLDFGCGRGMYSQLFKGFKKYSYTGIDPEKKNEWKKYKSARIKYSVQDGTKLKFKDNSFNFAIAITSLEHIKNEKKAISELYRLVKKGSYVIIIVPSKIYWLFQLGRHCYHHNSKKQLFRLVKTKPFKIVEYDKIGGPLSFLFTWLDIWLSQAVLLPFWLWRKANGKKLSGNEMKNILDNTIHLYMRFGLTRWIYFYILKYTDLFDSIFKMLPNHHLVVARKK